MNRDFAAAFCSERGDHGTWRRLTGRADQPGCAVHTPVATPSLATAGVTQDCSVAYSQLNFYKQAIGQTVRTIV